jgi:hypothetical protein
MIFVDSSERFKPLKRPKEFAGKQHNSPTVLIRVDALDEVNFEENQKLQ